MNRKEMIMIVSGISTGLCLLPASAGWLDSVAKVLDTAVRVTNAVESVRNPSQAAGTDTKAAAAVSTSKNATTASTVEEKKSEAATKSEAKVEEKAATAQASSRTALSEEEAEDIANGQPISMDMDDLAARMKVSSDYVLIDVRKPMEFKKGHIKGAKNVPFDDVSNSMPKPCNDKDKPIYLYCLSGDRAIAAGQYLIKNGYKRVYNCGGIDDWNGKLVK